MIIESKELIERKELPLYNEVGFFHTDSFTTTQPFNYKVLVDLIKKTPEAIGILRAIMIDVCSDGFKFYGPTIRVKKAEDFCKANRFKSELPAAVFDWLFLGNGALWKGNLKNDNSDKVKETFEKLSNLSGIEIKETEFKALIDEESSKTKKLKVAPWSSMNIEMNEKKTMITGYHQIVNGEKTVSFTPEEIIHAKFQQFDGRVYGFAPAEASFNVLSTLSLIKDVNGSFFKNGGIPDWMFILPEEQAGNPNVKKLEQTLAKYKGSLNKHGNMVFTGKVEPKELNKFDKDMEFRQLAIYYTGIFALAYGMPMARIAAIIGSVVKGGGAAATDLSEAGYWRSISSFQDYWEDLLNMQLFEPEFGVEIKFNRGYLNDQIKEAQRDVQMFEVLNKLALAGSIKPEYIKEKLQIPDRYWTGKFEPTQAGGGEFGGEFGSPGSTPKSMEKGTAGQAMIGQKKGEATASVERKELKERSVGFNEFNTLVQEMIKKSEIRKINWYFEDNQYTFIIDTTESSYSYSIAANLLSEAKKSDWISYGRKINPPKEKQRIEQEIKDLKDRKQKLISSISSEAIKDTEEKLKQSNEEIGKNKTKLQKITNKVGEEKSKLAKTQEIRDKVKKEIVEII